MANGSRDLLHRICFLIHGHQMCDEKGCWESSYHTHSPTYWASTYPRPPPFPTLLAYTQPPRPIQLVFTPNRLEIFGLGSWAWGIGLLRLGELPGGIPGEPSAPWTATWSSRSLVKTLWVNLVREQERLIPILQKNLIC